MRVKYGEKHNLQIFENKLIREMYWLSTINYEGNWEISVPNEKHRRSRWPRGVICRSVASYFLGFRVRIPPGAWSFFSFQCCVLRRGIIPNVMYMSVISKPQQWGGPGPSSAVAPQVIKMRNPAHISCGMLKVQPENFV